MRYPLALALASLVSVGAAQAQGTSAEGTDEDARVDALVAAGQTEEALTLARAHAEARPSVESWGRVLTYAGWVSDAEQALAALRALVALEPGERDHRLALAQRLLWAQSTAEALPHARWLVAREEEADPVALEVATWVFLAEARGEARPVLERWIAAAPDAPGPRWVLADLTHWTEGWRTASAVYDRLADDPGYAERVEDRRRRIRREHPAFVEARGTYWSDNFGVSYWAVGGRAQLQLPEQLVLGVRGWRGRFEQTLGPTVGSLGTVVSMASLRWEASQPIQLELEGGVDVDSQDHVVPIAIGRAHVSLFGKVFGRIEAGYDRYRASLGAGLEDVRTYYGRLVGYAEPVPWLFVGLDASVQGLSDGNVRGHGLLAVGLHNDDSFQVEPRLFGSFEVWDRLNDQAYPYFTLADPFTAGADVTLRYRFDEPNLRFKVEGTIGAIYQAGAFAFRPGARAELDAWEHLTASAAFAFVGSSEYEQLRFDATLGGRW